VITGLMVIGVTSLYVQSLAQQSHSLASDAPVKPPRPERVFVNLEAVYPNAPAGDDEFCFEELRARRRGWLDRNWREQTRSVENKDEQVDPIPVVRPSTPQRPEKLDNTIALIAQDLQQNLELNDENRENIPPSNDSPRKLQIVKRYQKEERANRTRKIRVMEVRGSTQTSINKSPS
jgi:checkpoint serine/threonine-protein kinase